STSEATLLSPRQHRFECNPMSTGVILLADILPGLIVKATAPFFQHRIAYSIRIAVCILFSTASLLIVGLTKPVWINLIGVACASIGSGFGEVTFLSLTALYDKNVVSTFSSGTGGAGIFGALSYAGLTEIGITPKHTVLIMLIVPVIQTISYWGLLTRHPSNVRSANQEDVQPLMEGTITPTFTFTEKMKVVK
ncbi:battenin-like, partial [Saccoglossus kowalevskii]|uniref:Battenin n=1 Tax=Saccoglossus kowalevskii TaxID=10224 RepID=A0ABM0LWL5_SACKO